MRPFWMLFAAAMAVTMAAEKMAVDFSQYPLNESPPAFRSTVSGEGEPGVWRVILDDPPPAPTSTDSAAPEPQQPVLAQLARDLTDEHFPLLVYEEQTFGDFTLTTQFKTVAGVRERMAGVAFRVQDERNYYYVRASSLGNTFRFFKVVDGLRGPAIGPEMVNIPSGVWHSLTIECQGNQIRCFLNGREVIPPLTDNTFQEGKVAFWTKSDSVSHFANLEITYQPRRTLADELVDDMLQRFPELHSLTIFALREGEKHPRVVATNDDNEKGRLGGPIERDVLQRGKTYFGRERKRRAVTVTLPIDDRNGEVVAAVRLVMESFLGQTEQNAIVRAMAIVKQMELRIRSAPDFPGR